MTEEIVKIIIFAAFALPISIGLLIYFIREIKWLDKDIERSKQRLAQFDNMFRSLTDDSQVPTRSPPRSCP